MILTKKMLANGIPAYLLIDITYKKDGKTIEIPSGTYITVNLDKQAALIGNDHVHIEKGEFREILAN